MEELLRMINRWRDGANGARLAMARQGNQIPCYLNELKIREQILTSCAQELFDHVASQLQVTEADKRDPKMTLAQQQAVKLELMLQDLKTHPRV